MLTLIGGADSLPQFLRRQFPLWFNDGTLAMAPRGLHGVEPRTFERSMGDDKPYASLRLGLAMMLLKPGFYFMRAMPRGMIPHQQPRFLPRLGKAFAPPGEKLHRSVANGPSLDKAQPYLLDRRSQSALTRQGYRVWSGGCVLPRHQADRFRGGPPGVHRRWG